MEVHITILVVAIGHLAAGSLDCGEYTISPGVSNSIESPNYPDKYGEKDSCKWEFTCDDSDGVIGISCDEFKTEEDDPCEDADYLRVSDSTGDIDYFCGKTGPDLESADNTLELKFKTDKDSTTKSGFSCSVLCTVKDSSSQPGATTESTSGSLDCGEHTITTGETYSIESPNYPDKYGKKDSCKWEFTCDDSDGVIGISCDDFKTEEDDPCEDADYLKVSDSTGDIDYFCGKTGPDLESADNTLELKFKTDKDSTTKSGFSCSVLCKAKASTSQPGATTESTSDSLGCGEHTITTGETYTIESPNYPDKYGETDSCKWEFTCDDSDGVIGISCDEFKTEEDDSCEDADYLRVKDSTGTLDNFCGKSGPDLESADNFLELKFRTDNDNKTKSGFSCSVLCSAKASTAQPDAASTAEEATTTPAATTESTSDSLDCGEHTITTGETYTIKSPNYPDKYGETDSCKWELTCDDTAGVIAISCDEFKTEEDDPCEDADYLRVKDSTGTLDNFCGKSGPDLESADNFLELKFRTDNDNKTKSGFSCSVLCSAKASTTPEDSTTQPDASSTAEEATTTPAGGDWSGECSAELIAYHGMKEYWVSPKYDGTTHYPHGDYCCSLNITIPKPLNMFMVNMEMESPSRIYETNQCTHDNIAYTGSSGHTSTICGELGGQTWSEVTAYNTPLHFHFTWCSTAADGHKTDIGFKMRITGKDLTLGR